MRLLIMFIVGAAASGIATLAAPARAADARAAPAFPGKTQLQFRLRAEAVDEAGFASDALATTLRTRLTWTSPGWRGWQATAEFDDVRALDADAYNSTINGRASRPVVADPAGTELNRAVLEWKHPKLDVALGRQRLALDNQRFIGNVGWRQNEQTVDGVSMRWHATKRAEVTAAWVTNVNRVFGPRSGAQSADWHGDTAILHGKADLGDLGTLSAFWHGLDFDNSAATSVATTGLLWSGIAKAGNGWRVPWAASIARQRDYGRNPSDYSASYRQLELGVGRGPATLKVGLESRGGARRGPTAGSRRRWRRCTCSRAGRTSSWRHRRRASRTATWRSKRPCTASRRCSAGTISARRRSRVPSGRNGTCRCRASSAIAMSCWASSPTIAPTASRPTLARPGSC